MFMLIFSITLPLYASLDEAKSYLAQTVTADANDTMSLTHALDLQLETYLATGKSNSVLQSAILSYENNHTFALASKILSADDASSYLAKLKSIQSEDSGFGEERGF